MPLLAGPEETDPLTVRQLDVLSLIALGYSNPQIAQELYYAPTSVNFVTQCIYKSLGAINRAHAVRKGHELGLLSKVPILTTEFTPWENEHLTPRELELAPLLSLGMSNERIGEIMSLTPRSVKAYALNLESKLGVRNKAHAVHATIKLGLIDLCVDHAQLCLRP